MIGNNPRSARGDFMSPAPAKITRVLNRKSKMVSFRVSSEDYERLRLFCVSNGQRSVSDLARLAVGNVVENGRAPSVETRLSEVENRIHLLTKELLRVSGEPRVEAGMDLYTNSMAV